MAQFVAVPLNGEEVTRTARQGQKYPPRNKAAWRGGNGLYHGDMAGVRLIIQFSAENAEIADTAIEESVERCKRAQQEPGCLQFEVFRSALDPTKYVLLEHWESKDALAVHAQGMSTNPPRPNPGITRVREDYEYAETAATSRR